MEPIKVYAVQGCSGSYSDYLEWIVVIFFDKQQAEDTAKYLNSLIALEMWKRQNDERQQYMKSYINRGWDVEKYEKWHREHNDYWNNQMFLNNGYHDYDTEYSVIEYEVC